MTTLTSRLGRRRGVSGLARAGLTARGLIYLLIGVLAIAVAAGRSAQETDQRGALNAVGQHAGGKLLLVLLALGFAGYALWRLSEAAWGVSYDPGTGPRLAALARALGYAALAASTVSVIVGGSGGSQANEQQSASARLMRAAGGRWLVGAIGLAVLAVGLWLVYQGLARKFTDGLRTASMSRRTRKVVEALGLIGTTARGLVFALAGALVVEAAVSFDPAKARGLDEALRTLAAQPYGKAMLAAVASGLVIFGIYGLAEARWHKT